MGNSRVVLAELDPHPYGVMFEHHPLPRIAALPMPVTWLLGERSRDWYDQLHAPVAAIVPGLRTERIEGASHLMHAEQPVAFADAVDRALAATA